MPFVTINNNVVEIDQIGRIVGAEMREVLHTSIGLVNLRLNRLIVGKQILVEADMYQSRESPDFDISYTTFCAGAIMKWDSQQYRVQTRQPLNEFWQELERLVSNVIVVNE